VGKLHLPKRIGRRRPERVQRSFPAHRAWVRRHHCCVPGCMELPIECAHVRGGTDGGIALKPSDRWVVSLCRLHHAEQHQVGETSFQATHGIDLRAIAEEFASRSPHRAHWEELQE
jgi:hypothetical protein